MDLSGLDNVVAADDALAQAPDRVAYAIQRYGTNEDGVLDILGRCDSVFRKHRRRLARAVNTAYG